MPNWKKLILSGSDAELNSLNATSALTASGLNYPSTDGTDGQVIMTDGSGILTFNDVSVYAQVKNITGGTLAKGTPVHASGSVGNTSEVIAASSSVASTMPATFVLAEELAAEEEGRAIVVGYINGVNTSPFNEGDVVYVGAEGGYTNVKPTGSSLIQNLGIVAKADVNGSGFIYGAGRSNDVPNITSGYAWVGNSDQVATAVATSSFVVTNADTASYVATANIDGTIDISDQTNLAGGANLTLSGDTMNLDADISLTSITASVISASSYEGDGSNLTGVGTVDTSGTPVNNQIAVFTDSDTIEGDSDLTWDSTTLDVNGMVDIDFNTTNTNTAVVDISNNTSAIMSTNHYTLKVAGGQANGAPSGQQKSYGGYFTAGNTNGAFPDSIALYAQGHEDGAPNSYAAIFSGSAGGVVGINTMEPTVELEVDGDGKFSGTLEIGGISDVSASLATIPTNNNQLTNGAGYTTNTGTVDTTGTPANNQLAIFTDSDTIEGDSDLTWDGSTFTITGYNRIPNTDGSEQYYGDVVAFGGGGTLTQGSIYYLDSSQNWQLADASAASTAEGMLGIATDTSIRLLVKGIARHTSWAGLGHGSVLYLSETSGELTTTKPTTSGAIVRVIGYCTNTTTREIYFNPSTDWIELA